MDKKGVLYVVAGPIGNLLDITYRAIDILKSCDIILSEDTRETSKILQKFSINTRQISYRDQNHEKILPKVIEILDIGSNVALVSDSGTPTISDPGYKLIHKLKALGFEVKPIPGPSAVISALSVSGLPTDKFSFLGFLPKSRAARYKILLEYGNLDSTVVIYESPFRILRLLEEINESLGDRVVCVARELTKIFEEVKTAKISDFISKKEKIGSKGEFVVLIAKKDFDEKR